MRGNVMRFILWLGVLGTLITSIVGTPVDAKPSGVPVHPSARCAVFWSAMTRGVPQGSPPLKESIARKEAWLAHAVSAIGETKANRILNADGPYYGNQVREMAGDADAIRAFAANYSSCETAPSSGPPIIRNAAPAVSAKPIPTVTAKDKESGDRAFRCAGMAQMNEDIGNFVATKYYGKLSDYLPIIQHFRPDLSDVEIKKRVISAQMEYAKLLERDKSARRTATLAGKQWDVEKSEGAVLFQGCAQMANVMSRFIKK